MSSTYSAASADSASDSKEPGCELSHSVRSIHTPAPSSPSTEPSMEALTLAAVVIVPLIVLVYVVLEG